MRVMTSDNSLHLSELILPQNRIPKFKFKAMKTILELIEKTNHYSDRYHTINSKVSSASVGWHIAHSYLALSSICRALVNSDPALYVSPPFNLKKIIVKNLGMIPRGKGKAPETVLPAGNIDPATLKELFEKSISSILGIENLPENSFFNHPVFGVLNKSEAIRFIQIHTKHHLKIIKDILSA
jgi:hypothetical protein